MISHDQDKKYLTIYFHIHVNIIILFECYNNYIWCMLVFEYNRIKKIILFLERAMQIMHSRYYHLS